MAFDKNFYKQREKMRRWDEKNVLDYAVAQAIEQLKKEMHRQYAQSMKLRGWQLSDIADITGLATEEIEQL